MYMYVIVGNPWSISNTLHHLWLTQRIFVVFVFIIPNRNEKAKLFSISFKKKNFDHVLIRALVLLRLMRFLHKMAKELIGLGN